MLSPGIGFQDKLCLASVDFLDELNLAPLLNSNFVDDKIFLITAAETIKIKP